MGLNPPPGYFKLFGALLPVQPPEEAPIAPIAVLPVQPPAEAAIDAIPLRVRVSGAKRGRSAEPPRKRKGSRKWPPQPLPQRYRELLHQMGGSEPTLICTRTIYRSDVDKGLNRLTISPKQAMAPFLSEAEEDFIQRRDANKKPNKLWVSVVDPGLAVRAMRLAKWNCRQGGVGNKSGWYALTKNWIEIVRANALVPRDSIQLWSFRIDGQLGFVIHKVDSPSQEPQADGSSVGDRT